MNEWMNDDDNNNNIKFLDTPLTLEGPLTTLALSGLNVFFWGGGWKHWFQVIFWISKPLLMAATNIVSKFQTQKFAWSKDG